MCPTGGADGVKAETELAVAYNSIDLGILYQVSESIRIGAMLKNGFGFATQEKYREFAPPKYATLAFSVTIRQTVLALDSEHVFGRFGGRTKQTADIWLLRGGLENRLTHRLRLRAGLVYPVTVRSSSLGDLTKELPWPRMGATLGLGLVQKRFNIDLALYGDPAKSYVQREPVLGATGTVVLKF